MPNYAVPNYNLVAAVLALGLELFSVGGWGGGPLLMLGRLRLSPHLSSVTLNAATDGCASQFDVRFY